MQSMPLLDVTALNPKQLEKAAKLFDEICQKPRLPLHQIDKDTVRHELDERFGREVLRSLEPSRKPFTRCTVSSSPLFSSLCKIFRTKDANSLNASTIIVFDK